MLVCVVGNNFFLVFYFIFLYILEICFLVAKNMFYQIIIKSIYCSVQKKKKKGKKKKYPKVLSLTMRVILKLLNADTFFYLLAIIRHKHYKNVRYIYKIIYCCCCCLSNVQVKKNIINTYNCDYPAVVISTLPDLTHLLDVHGREPCDKLLLLFL